MPGLHDEQASAEYVAALLYVVRSERLGLRASALASWGNRG
jgi:hypothetical protein